MESTPTSSRVEPDRAIDELLEGPLFRAVGPSHWDCEEKRDWWLTHGPHLLAWLRGQIRPGRVDVDELEQLRSGAQTLLTVPEARGWGSCPQIPEREPYSWEEIDAYEILFDKLALGCMPDHWQACHVVEGIRSFAEYLGRRGVIPDEDYERLQREFVVWIPRVLEFFESDRWYERPPTG